MFETQNMSPHCYEKVRSDVYRQEADRRAIVIDGLKKTYQNGFQAVNGLNLKLFSSQIFCLLGHNGAGKTSTISMLTGMFEATEGSVEVFGCDLGSQMEQIRQVMGVCP